MIARNMTLKLWHVAVPCVAGVLLAGCGGGGSGSSGNVTTYSVSATAGAGGSISPASSTVDAGGKTTLTITPGSGYAIGAVTGCGGTLAGDTYTTGAITSNCTVTAAFVAQYEVTATAGTGGVVYPLTAQVDTGNSTFFTVTPKSGYVISSVTGCGGSLSGNTYTTGSISAACTVTASFDAAFTWVSGSNATDAGGVYGTQGVAAAANVPGARDDGVSWTDASGDLWMFGGFAGYASSANPPTGNFMSDLWKYSPSTGEWTWVGGPNTACSQGVYGVKGVAAVGNWPGPRSAVNSWTDAQGNVWMFGGGGCDSSDNFVVYDDLWRYSPSSGEWTWVGGSSTAYASAVYGTQGVPAPGNDPGARADSALWTDASGNVWMFGGWAYDSSTSSAVYLNDLWEYSPASGEWTWVGGPNSHDGSGVYGTQGVAAATNTPGARSGAQFWQDSQGNFWLFGGGGYGSTAQLGELNDLWEYSTSTRAWTWVAGPDTVNAPGAYGTRGIAAAQNVPAPRDGAATWIDASGNLWLFGGEGYDASKGWYHRLNDLWKYSPSLRQWTWVAGSSTFDATGVYGTRGVAAAANVPGARGVPLYWKDAGGDLWLFGGYQYDDPTNTRFEMNDLWKYPTE